MSALAEGRSLGRYELVSKTGSGAAQRWLARQAGVGKLVELRVVEGIPADVTAAMDRARIVAQLEHANLAKVLDVETIDGVSFIVTEHLDGETLASLLDAGRTGKRLDELGMARVIADAAEGIDAAHEHVDSNGGSYALVARRLSPSTIVVLYTGAIKVVALDALGAGPLAYQAPERLDSLAVTGDRRGDVFSLGSILWEALTAERLFDPAERLPPSEAAGDDAIKRLVRHLEIASPAELNANVPEPLSEVCLRALARDLTKRQPSAKRFAVEIEEVLVQAGYSRRNEKIAAYMSDAFSEQISAKRQRSGRISIPPSMRAPAPSTPPATVPVAAPVPVPVPAAAPVPVPVPVPAPVPVPVPVPAPVPAPAPSLASTSLGLGPALTAPTIPPKPAALIPSPPILPGSSAPAMPAVTAAAADPPLFPRPSSADDFADEKPLVSRQTLPLGFAIKPPGPSSSAAIATAVEPVSADVKSDGIPVVAPKPELKSDSKPTVGRPRLKSEPLPDAAAVVSLERPSKDVIDNWSWQSGSVPALRDDEFEDEAPRHNRKPLYLAIGGAGVAILLVAIVAIAMGGSPDEPPKPKTAALPVLPDTPSRGTNPPPTPPVADQAIAPLDTGSGSGSGSGSADAGSGSGSAITDAGSGSGSSAVVAAGSGSGSGSAVALITPPTPPTPPKTPPTPPPQPPKTVAHRPDPKPQDPYSQSKPPIQSPPPPKKPPGDAAASYKTGFQAYVRGDNGTALTALRAAIAADPGYAPAWRVLGLVFEKQGERDQARAAFRRYLALAPNAGDADQIRSRLEKLGS